MTTNLTEVETVEPMVCAILIPRRPTRRVGIDTRIKKPIIVRFDSRHYSETSNRRNFR